MSARESLDGARAKRGVVARTSAQPGLPPGLIGEVLRSPPVCMILIQNLLKLFLGTESMPRAADSMDNTRLRMWLIKRKTDEGGRNGRLPRKDFQQEDCSAKPARLSA